MFSFKFFLHIFSHFLLLKMRHYLEMLNERYMQFGIWEEKLSIDEQMVPYFGHHSSKMFIRGKPIRFGYKMWCLCSSYGYLFCALPYSGSSDAYDKNIGLGAGVVLKLLENVKNPQQHQVFFDNFFTSYQLLTLLSERRFCATGTVRNNRLDDAHKELKTGKNLQEGIN